MIPVRGLMPTISILSGHSVRGPEEAPFFQSFSSIAFPCFSTSDFHRAASSHRGFVRAPFHHIRFWALFRFGLGKNFLRKQEGSTECKLWPLPDFLSAYTPVPTE